MIWVAVVGCLVAIFIFSGLEAGLLTVSRVRLRHHAKQKEKAAQKLERLLEAPDRILLTVLIVTNLLTVVALVISTRELVDFMGQWGYGASLALWLPLYLFVLQLLPKSLFRRFPYRALALFAGVLSVAERVLSPLVAAGAWLAAIFYPRSRREQRTLFVAREDVKFFMAEGERVGTLTELERAMIHNVVDFRAVLAKDIMIPLDKVFAATPEMAVEELVRISREKDIERLPVMTDGKLTGLVNAFDILLERTPGSNVGSYLRRIVTVAPEETAYSVISKLRTSRTSLAAVTAPDGRSLGVVTSEDLIRRLVSVAVG